MKLNTKVQQSFCEFRMQSKVLICEMLCDKSAFDVLQRCCSYLCIMCSLICVLHECFMRMTRNAGKLVSVSETYSL